MANQSKKVDEDRAVEHRRANILTKRSTRTSLNVIPATIYKREPFEFQSETLFYLDRCSNSVKLNMLSCHQNSTTSHREQNKNKMHQKSSTSETFSDDFYWEYKYKLPAGENLTECFVVCPRQSISVKCETSLSHSLKWKNGRETVISQTNNIQNINIINANECLDQSKNRRHCRRVDQAIDVEIRSDDTDVTQNNFARDCVQSTDLRNNLSKLTIRPSCCSSCEGNRLGKTYQESKKSHQQLYNIKRSVCRNENQSRNHSTTKTKKRKILSNWFPPNRFQRFLSYLNYFIRFYGKRKMLHQLSYAFCLMFIILSTSTTNAEFPHQSHSIGGGSERYPRHSGFRRTFKSEAERCETITIPTCKDIGYNKTDMSLSFINKFNQDEAQKELDLFGPLIRMNCSTELKLFLCSIYTPICMKTYKQFLPPCRFICERAKSGCLPIMQHYGERWPSALACDQFPLYTKDRPMCMHFNLTKTHHHPYDSRTDAPALKSSTNKPNTITKQKHDKTTRLVTTTTTKHPITKRMKNIKTSSPKAVVRVVPSKINAFDETAEIIKKANNATMCICRQPMVTIQNPSDPLYNKVSTGGVPNCAVSCKSPYFSDEQISVAETWIKSWSIVCFVVTLMTVSTFLIDMERFKYPERPIIFLSTCYMFVSIGFLIRIIAGHEAVACASKTDHVLYHTTGPVLCTVVFLLVYFFSMASSLWWVILSMTWFLASGLKWGSEAIERYSQYYHAAAWLIPSLKSVMILAMSSVDGDSLSGICYVGNQDVRTLRGFVLAPLVVYLTLGGMFLFAGFISLFRIRSRIKQGGTKTDDLEKHMGRIGVFSVLYMVPAAALVACYFYEQQYRSLWEYSHNCKTRLQENTELSQVSIVSDVHVNGHVNPEFIVFMVRYLMTLLIGITNGVWICSPKTLESWKKFYRRCVCFVCGTPYPITSGKDISKPKSVGGHVSDRESGQYRFNSETSQQKYSRKSMEHSTESENNRCDVCLTRSYDSTKPIHNMQNNYQIKSLSGNSSSSRRTRLCPSNTSSRVASCEVCNRSSRTSSSTTRSKRSRKSREIRSRNGSTENGRSSEKTRLKSRKDGEICCSNTTSTDGSDHLSNGISNNDTVLETESKLDSVADCSLKHEVEIQNEGDHYKQTIISDHVTSEFRADNKTEYVINQDDLFPIVTDSLIGMRPHNFSSQTSHELERTCDCDDASFENMSPISSLPHYHHYHHHYH